MKNSPASLTAGFCAGVAEVIVGYPFDTLKTRLQTSGQLDKSTCSDLFSAWKCAKTTFKLEGLAGFYRGFLPLLLQEALGVSLLFGARDWMRENIGADIWRPGAFLLACCLIGLLEAIVYCPLDHIKARMQVRNATSIYDRLPLNGKPVRSPPPESNSFKRSFGPNGNVMSRDWAFVEVSADKPGVERPMGALTELRTCMWSIIRARGYSGLYLGFILQVFKEMIGNVALFGVYDATLMLLSGFHSTNQSWAAVWPAGSLAGISYYLVSYPFDTLKSKLQTDSLVSPKYQGSMHCIRKVIFHESTISDLYHGLSMCLLRAIPGGAAEFFIFEVVFLFLYKGTNPAKFPELIKLQAVQTGISNFFK